MAHPAFVRPGLALVAAYRHCQQENPERLNELIAALVFDDAERDDLFHFTATPDVQGLSRDDPRYERAVLAATLNESKVIANNDPEEVRFNVFQSLQYLADWLCGNGCVALPATMRNAKGENVFVRIMDDLATTERSRWEVWAEIHHGRFSREDFEKILQEEMEFIRTDQDTTSRRIEIRYRGEAVKWYPVAERIVRQLMTDSDPVEFVSELLLSFTFDVVRNADDPWQAAMVLCPGKYRG